jgi:hypothetical protein
MLAVLYVLTRIYPALCPGMYGVFQDDSRACEETELHEGFDTAPAFRTRCALQSQEVVLITLYRSLIRYGETVLVSIYSSKCRVQITNSKHTM